MKKLEVRNSPLDHIASLTLKLATCIKGACVAGGASATVLGLGFGADKLLEEDLKDFKKEFINELQKEKNMKDIQQSKILAELKKIKRD